MKRAAGKRKARCLARTKTMCMDYHVCSLAKGHKGKHRCRRVLEFPEKGKHCKFTWRVGHVSKGKMRLGVRR